MRKILKRAAALLLISLFILLPLPVTARAISTNIKVAINCNMPPFQFFDENGNIAGLHIDIMNEIADKEDLQIEYVIFDETSEAISALENGAVDAVLGTMSDMSVSPLLRATNDISSASLCMLVDNRIVYRVLHPEFNPQGYNIAFELDMISLSQLSNLNLMNTIIMGNQVQLFNALMEENVDAVIGVKDSMVYLLEREGVNDYYTIVHNYIASVNFSILTQRNDRVLFNSLNRGISQLRASGVYEQLIDKWTANIELKNARALSRKMLYYITIFVSVALIVIGLIGYMNYRLKKTVAEKTREIRSRVHQLENESVLRDRLIEFSLSGIMLLKADGTVLLMNSIARTMAGIEGYEDAQKSYNIRDMNILGELWEHMALQNKTAMERPSIVKLNSNTANSRIFRYRCHSINEEDDKVMMVEDITREEEEKQQRFELSKSKSLNRIIAGMAHEIKNPLMSINTFASLIQQQGNDADFQASFAQYVPKEVERINRLIELLINYARPTRSKKERVLVSELIDDASYFAHITAKNQQIDFQTYVSANTYVHVNRDQIRQSLINLVLNSIQSVEEKLAAKACTADKLDIRVSCYQRSGQICIEVYDEGCGMTESELEKCMEPFFTTKANGIGMGLAVTRQFVYENSGKLELESSKNEFTTIRMVFEEDITD